MISASRASAARVTVSLIMSAVVVSEISVRP